MEEDCQLQIQMIGVARAGGALNAQSKPVRFEVSSAESLGSELHQPVANASVDLITAANAAHWFDMAAFWVSAAKVLKPGGSVGLWCSGHIRLHPSVPNAEAMQVALDQLEKDEMEPFFEAGNFLTKTRYDDLVLPWHVNPCVEEFDQRTFYRREWSPEEEFYGKPVDVDLDTFERMVSTGSVVTRWRQAHPDTAGTERDIVKIQRRTIEKYLHEAGVMPGEERVKGVVLGTLLVIKKKAVAGE